MSNDVLKCHVKRHPESPLVSDSMRDQMQIALAIAEEGVLKALLGSCQPAVAPLHRIGSVVSRIGVPLTAKKTVDAIIQFEQIDCVLLDTPVETDLQFATGRGGDSSSGLQPDLTRCMSELRTLGQSLPLAQAIALLSHAGFIPRQVDDILNLPYQAWHKTWWYMADRDGNFTLPFLRLIRTLRYVDGTFTLQYKDYFPQDRPPCFYATEQKVLVEIKPRLDSFSKTLEKINYAREQCGIQRAILICNHLSDLEAQGFMSQGISIYPSPELERAAPANCMYCTQSHCPMNGAENSPVVSCRQFVPPGYLMAT